EVGDFPFDPKGRELALEQALDAASQLGDGEDLRWLGHDNAASCHDSYDSTGEFLRLAGGEPTRHNPVVDEDSVEMCPAQTGGRGAGPDLAVAIRSRRLDYATH